MSPPPPLWHKEILNYLVSKQTPSVKSSRYTPRTVCGESRIKDRIGERGSYWMFLVPREIHACYVEEYRVFICI